MAVDLKRDGEDIDPKELAAVQIAMLQPGTKIGALEMAFEGMTLEQLERLNEGLTQEAKAKLK